MVERLKRFIDVLCGFIRHTCCSYGCKLYFKVIMFSLPFIFSLIFCLLHVLRIVFLPKLRVFDMVMLWLGGLLIWFFGFYSFISKEVEEAVERLKSLEELRKRDNKVEQAMKAQKAILSILGKSCCRVILIHIPGFYVGFYASLSVLLSLVYHISLPSRNLLYLFSISLVTATVLCLTLIAIFGTILLTCLFLKNKPARMFFEAVLDQ